MAEDPLMNLPEIPIKLICESSNEIEISSGTESQSSSRPCRFKIIWSAYVTAPLHARRAWPLDGLGRRGLNLQAFHVIISLGFMISGRPASSMFPVQVTVSLYLSLPLNLKTR
jgi:hypothetical protein